MARTYPAQPEAPLTTAGMPAQLFDASIDAMLTRRRTQPAPGKSVPAPAYGRAETLGWLGWLARGMREHDQAQFRLDRLQPTWLSTPAQRRAMRRWPRIAVGLGAGLIYGRRFLLTVPCAAHPARAGRCVPWRAVRFLGYATERVLLRRVGGAYEFIHPLLLDYLAPMPPCPSDREGRRTTIGSSEEETDDAAVRVQGS